MKSVDMYSICTYIVYPFPNNKLLTSSLIPYLSPQIFYSRKPTARKCSISSLYSTHLIQDGRRQEKSLGNDVLQRLGQAIPANICYETITRTGYTILQSSVKLSQRARQNTIHEHIFSFKQLGSYALMLIPQLIMYASECLTISQLNTLK